MNTPDPSASERKRDHIELAFRAQVAANALDSRFAYEPIFAAHPPADATVPIKFLGKELRVPMWVSSMTGGTVEAANINRNLARACHDFGMGMGLGSCRQLLYSNEHLDDFAVRGIMGDDVPLYANLGIAQLEELIDTGKLELVDILLDKLEADGLIIHVNPLQEWLQPEGDRFRHPPIDTIQRVLEYTERSSRRGVIVKEVGQGFGSASLRTLFSLPLAAIDFAASGGTNFALLELLRADEDLKAAYMPLAQIGHSAVEMVDIANHILADLGEDVRCFEVIISGGVQNFLDGYYLTERLNTTAVYGQASALLRHARTDYDTLHRFVAGQVRGLALAKAILTVRK